MNPSQSHKAISLPENLHHISDAQAVALCSSLRQELLHIVSRTGGHLSSNLGAVELTVALHRVYHTERDRLVFDVGHQCYVHKMLTGRRGAMDTLRKLDGLSGFPKPWESPHDAFIAGHASNAVSVALGMAYARTQLKQHHHVVALIGDGSLTGGLAYEGLSCAGQSHQPLVVVLNDNGMAITRNVGGVARYLAHQRLKPRYLQVKRVYRNLTQSSPSGQRFYQVTHRMKEAVKNALIPGRFFEMLGFRYLGPVDGHDVINLTRLLYEARDSREPVLLHVRTVKGHGYPPAEKNPDAYHGVGPFSLKEGLSPLPPPPSYSQVFGETLCRIAQENPAVCAITAAMLPGVSLTEFAARYPERCHDVGIAEEHAVAMAAGMAKAGLRPVFAVYSTFLQRAYDMLLHDVGILSLPVLLAVDRAGIVGADGETHQGLFDLAYLSTVPGMTIYAPASFAELRALLQRALGADGPTGPCAIRYPRGGEGDYRADNSAEDFCRLRAGGDLTLLTYGGMTDEVLAAADTLAREDARAVQVLKLNRLLPLPEGLLPALADSPALFVVEDVVAAGSVGQRLAAALAVSAGPRPGQLVLCSCGDRYLPHGSVPQLRQLCGIDRESLVARVREVLPRD